MCLHIFFFKWTSENLSGNNMSEEKKECKYQYRGRILQAKEEESDLKQEVVVVVGGGVGRLGLANKGWPEKLSQ